MALTRTKTAWLSARRNGDNEPKKRKVRILWGFRSSSNNSDGSVTADTIMTDDSTIESGTDSSHSRQQQTAALQDESERLEMDSLRNSSRTMTRFRASSLCYSVDDDDEDYEDEYGPAGKVSSMDSIPTLIDTDRRDSDELLGLEFLDQSASS